MSVSVDLRVLELVCSRICHDLVSPVGAINNGVELIRELSEDGAAGKGLEEEALALIAHSAEQGSRRLRLMRLSYGAAGADASWDDVQSALQDFFEGSRVTIVWPQSREGIPIDTRGFGKLIVNAVLVASDALGQNGTIALELRNGSLAVVATGKSATLDAERAAALTGGKSSNDLDPRSIHAYVTAQFAAHYGVSMKMKQDGAERLELLLSV